MRVDPHVARDDHKEGGHRFDGAVNLGVGFLRPRKGLELVRVRLAAREEANVDVVVHENAPGLGLVPSHARLPVKVEAVFEEHVLKDRDRQRIGTLKHTMNDHRWSTKQSSGERPPSMTLLVASYVT